MAHTKRNCDNPECGKSYLADNRALNRGWGKTCSKSCAAKVREMSKPGYDPKRVATNNVRRILWNDNPLFQNSKPSAQVEDYDPGDSEYWDNSSNGMYGD